MEQNSEYRTYVYDYARKHQWGSCLFLYRRKREEKPQLWEDIALEVPLDLRNRNPLSGKEQFHRYIFEPYEDRTVVMNLSIDSIMDNSVTFSPLDPDTMERFESQPDRFPSLTTAPLPIAVRDVPYEIL